MQISMKNFNKKKKKVKTEEFLKKHLKKRTKIDKIFVLRKS